MKLLDCTLRDGGYQNAWKFSDDFIDRYILLMDAIGVDVIELGIRSNKRQANVGELSYSPDEYIEKLPNTSARYSVLSNISEFVDEDISYLRKLFPKSSNESKFTVVRLAGSYEDILQCERHIDYIKSLGFTVCLNLMRVSTVSRQLLASMIKKLDTDAFDVFYVADSFGSLEPSAVNEIIDLICTIKNVEIGVHFHDNKGLALINTIEAHSCGANWLDTTLMGMGRGAGNAATEKFITSIGKDHRLSEAVDFIESYVMPFFANSPWGPAVDFYLSGLWNIHPNFVSKMRDMHLSGVDRIKVLKFLKTSECENFNIEHLRGALEQI